MDLQYNPALVISVCVPVFLKQLNTLQKRDNTYFDYDTVEGDGVGIAVNEPC